MRTIFIGSHFFLMQSEATWNSLRNPNHIIHNQTPHITQKPLKPIQNHLKCMKCIL